MSSVLVLGLVIVAAPAAVPADPIAEAAERALRHPTDTRALDELARLAVAEDTPDPILAVLGALADDPRPQCARGRQELADRSLDLLLRHGHAHRALDALGEPAARFEARIARHAILEAELLRPTVVEERLRLLTGPGSRPAPEILDESRRALARAGLSYARLLVACGRTEDAGRLTARLLTVAPDALAREESPRDPTGLAPRDGHEP